MIGSMFVLLVLGFSQALLGQAVVNATLVGTVTDNTGATVPKATVARCRERHRNCSYRCHQ